MFMRVQKLIPTQAELVELIQKGGFTVALNYFKAEDHYACVVCRGLFVTPAEMREAIAVFNEATTEDMNVHLTEFGPRETVIELALAWVAQIL